MASLTRGYRALGFEFRFESDDSGLVDLFDYAYRDLAAATGDVHVLRAEPIPGGYQVTVESPGGDREVCEDEVHSSGTFDVLVWEVNHRATASRATWTVLHATAIGGPLGGLVLCGPSHCGKSTLAAGAARRGWTHLSDDLAPLDSATQAIEPYQRPIMVRSDAAQALGDLPALPTGHDRFLPQGAFYPASALGATWASSPLPLRAVVALSWGDETRLTPVGRARTLYTLARNCTTLERRGAQGFADLEEIASRVPGYELVMATPDHALDVLAPFVGAADRSVS